MEELRLYIVDLAYDAVNEGRFNHIEETQRVSVSLDWAEMEAALHVEIDVETDRRDV